MGLHRAGFEVVGFDIEPQPRYPFEFHQQDALTVDLGGFDAVWASPPCQFISKAAQQWRNAGKEYPNLIPATRLLLQDSGKPYIIENVTGSVLEGPVLLNGATFGLRVKRDRYFEVNPPMAQPMLLSDAKPRKMGRPFDARKGQLFYPVGHFSGVAEARVAMGIDWMGQKDLAQAIPPAYSEYLGNNLMAVLS
jgi:DNA (cytosine-5)-methyltransferase 1